MNNKTISILGCGWLGLPLAQYLISKHYKVNGATRSENKNELLISHGIKPFNINTSDLNNTITGFLQSDILICAIPSKDLHAFKNLIHEIEKSPLKKVIFISSTSVYPANNKTITELDNTNDGPLAQIEKLFLSNTNLNTTILRFGGLIGPNRNPGNFFKTGRKLKAPNHPVNMIHLEDCIHIIERTIQYKNRNNVLNACADTHPTKREFYGRMTQLAQQKTPQFDNSSTSSFKIISNNKLKNQLNYTFIYSDLMQLTLPDF
ncbi:MAG: NAD(P)-dependent oxidoreductase [Flavobacteriaceae bacterium]|nr:MAG: NAD(P)-dependent oxidoreductase [Flavobacteriaceae bacterium]